MIRAAYSTADAILGAWRDDLLTGTPPILYPVGTGELSRIEIGPGLVSLFGGAPGAGKTALVMQLVVDALRLTPDLRAVVCNIEMDPRTLLDRQLARLSGVPATAIRRRQLASEHTERIAAGLDAIEGFAERLCFVRPPFDLGNVAAVLDAFEPHILLLDYIQRIPPPGDYRDRRGSVDAAMSFLREFAEHLAVMVVAAVARQKKDKGGSTYEASTLSLASFRESSELEFGADDAFILAPGSSSVTLKHLKSRHSEPRDIELTFNRSTQGFYSDSDEGDADGESPTAQGPPALADHEVLASPPAWLAAAWNDTEPAEGDDEEEAEIDA